MHKLEDHLLALAAAVTGDGGDAVVRMLREQAALSTDFEEGEVALAEPVGYRRWTFTDDERPLLGEDLLRHVAGQTRASRFDHPRDLEPFPETLEMMQRRGLSSLLVVPLTAGGELQGALTLAARHPWAFVAARLRLLEPLAHMAGEALRATRTLTKLQRQADAWLRVPVQSQAPTDPPVKDHAPRARPDKTGEHGEGPSEAPPARVAPSDLQAELEHLREETQRLTADRDSALAARDTARAERDDALAERDAAIALLALDEVEMERTRTEEPESGRPERGEAAAESTTAAEETTPSIMGAGLGERPPEQDPPAEPATGDHPDDLPGGAEHDTSVAPTAQLESTETGQGDFHTESDKARRRAQRRSKKHRRQ